MVRLLLVTASLVVVLSLAILGARLIGTAQPAPAFAQLFTNPDGTPCQRPCMFGIRVGETTVEQARQLLHLHPLTRMMIERTTSGNFVIDAANATVYVSPQIDETVKNVRLSYQLNTGVKAPPIVKIPLGEAITVLGKPIRVFPQLVSGISNSAALFILEYDVDRSCLNLMTVSSLEKIQTADYIQGVDIWLSTDVPCQQGDGRSWKGFSTPKHYGIGPFED